MKYVICFAASMILCGGNLDASCAPIDSGTRIWDIANEDLVIDCETLSKVTVIDSKIDELDRCGATVIITGNGIDLTNAGVYCLSEDMQGTVTISSSNITLDLNGHTIEGVITTAPSSSLQNILIRNGTIVVPTSPTELTGITISGIDASNRVENIQLQDLAVYCNGNCMDSSGGARGVYIDFATQVSISRLYCNGAVDTNIQIDNADTVRVHLSDFVNSCSAGATIGVGGQVDALVMTDCTFFENSLYGVECINGINSEIRGCSFTSNGTGLNILGGSTDILIEDCQAASGSADGFVVQGSVQRISFADCQATGNQSSGFVLAQNSDRIELTNCQAIGNDHNGFYLLDNALESSFASCQALGNSLSGFLMQNSVQRILLTSCLAQGNSTVGFNLTGVATAMSFNACQAQANGEHGFVLLQNVSEADLSACQASGNQMNGFYITGSSQEIILTGCQANANSSNGVLVEGTAGVVVVGCNANHNATDGFNINNSSGAVVTIKESMAVANAATGFNDAVGAASTSRYVACYAQGNTTDNYSTAGAPFSAVDATTNGINYWNNTFSV